MSNNRSKEKIKNVAKLVGVSDTSINNTNIEELKR